MAELFAFGGDTIALDVSSTTARIALPQSVAQAGGVVRIFVDGDVPVFVAPGGGTVAAVIPVSGGASGAMPMVPARETGFTLAGGQTHLAFITTSGTATVYITQGSGI